MQAFINEANQQQARFSLLGKQHGYSQDYDHISMLTHPAAVREHFNDLAQWLKAIHPSLLKVQS
ncbi:hypothetical protein [Alishewanella longhuensis]